MTFNWDRYSRFGIDAASTAASLGFSAAKFGTKLGFSITRGIASSAVGLTGSAVDHAFFGGNIGAGPALGGAVSTFISLIEQLALAPILLGETVTSTSIIAAHSSINVLSAIFPGSEEASFSLASFVELVRREWNDPVLREHLPEEKYGVGEVARALVAWGALQGATHQDQERRWFKYLREIPPETTNPLDEPRTRKDSRVRVTKDVTYPGNRGQIITADIGEAPASSSSPVSPDTPTSNSPFTIRTSASLPLIAPRRRTNSEIKATLRRLSKLVLAGYGGASLLFFGVSLDPPDANSPRRANERAKLANAIDASEADAKPPQPSSAGSSYSWWNILLGRHDREIFEKFANDQAEEEREVQKEIVEERKRKISAVIGDERLMPRFWVLRDHGRRQVVLVLRGTMSLNELAVDLTCDPEDFEPASTLSTADGLPEDEEEDMPGSFPMDAQLDALRPPHQRMRTTSTASSIGGPRYQVHGGMLRMARVMGGKGKPVHVAVRDALKRNKGYELVLCGHSLGAGVVGLLGLIWADPRTCLTVRSSGLPAGRRVSVYCFAPPCLTDPALTQLSSSLIHSFVYSNDIVSRLSLGSMRDITRATAWLCDANAKGSEDGYAGVTKRVMKWKTGFGGYGDEEWFLAIRKTLEANMHMAHLFPPGRVWWAVRDEDFHPKHRSKKAGSGSVRLFEVTDVEKVFGQIVFARDMLSSHLPHQYDLAVHAIS